MSKVQDWNNSRGFTTDVHVNKQFEVPRPFVEQVHWYEHNEGNNTVWKRKFNGNREDTIEEWDLHQKMEICFTYIAPKEQIIQVIFPVSFPLCNIHKK